LVPVYILYIYPAFILVKLVKLVAASIAIISEGTIESLTVGTIKSLARQIPVVRVGMFILEVTIATFTWIALYHSFIEVIGILSKYFGSTH